MGVIDREPSQAVIEGVKHGWAALLFLLLGIVLVLLGVQLMGYRQLRPLVKFLFTGFFLLGTAYGVVWLSFTYMYPDIAVEYDFQFPSITPASARYYEIESRLGLSFARIIPYLVTVGMGIGAVWVWTTV